MEMLDSLHRKLRPGDFVLVKDPPFRKPVAAEIIHTHRFDGLCVKFADGRQRWFSSREGFADILGAARLVDGNYIPL